MAGLTLYTNSYDYCAGDLITPIVAALSCQILEDLHEDYRDLFTLYVCQAMSLYSVIYMMRAIRY